MRYTYLLLIFLVNCSLPDPRKFKSIDQEALPYVQLFESHWGNKIGDIPIGFTDLHEGITGRCVKYLKGKKEIQIDRKSWDGMLQESMRVGLIFHELGHCALGLQHDTTFIANPSVSDFIRYIPRSFMYPYDFYSDFYSDNEDYYINQLFNRLESIPEEYAFERGK